MGSTAIEAAADTVAAAESILSCASTASSGSAWHAIRANTARDKVVIFKILFIGLTRSFFNWANFFAASLFCDSAFFGGFA